MNFEDKLRNYAKVVIERGINVQKGMPLVINTSTEAMDFVRLLTELAYERGASEVIVRIQDDECNRLSAMMMSEEAIKHAPEWKLNMMLDFAERKAGFLSVAAPNPSLMKDVDPERIKLMRSVNANLMKPFQKYTMNDINPWCVICIPSKTWADKVLPDVAEEKRVEELWDLIFKIVRVDGADPDKAWDEFENTIQEKAKYLNEMQFEKLHYRSKLGTDLTIEMPKNHLWIGGSSMSETGVRFTANIPTEEIFSAPKRDGVNGIVYATKPLSLSGKLVENFSLRFEDGKCVEVKAEKNQKLLEDLIATDENACMLGEVALVQNDSPISNSKRLFYSTLFDENASCHLAFGAAYPTCVQGGAAMSEEELLANGINDSKIHVDFMIGDETTEIIGYKDVKEYKIFKEGNWAF